MGDCHHLEIIIASDPNDQRYESVTCKACGLSKRRMTHAHTEQMRAQAAIIDAKDTPSQQG